MTSNVSRVPSVLYEIQTSSTETALTSLAILNEIISTNEEEMEYLFKSGGFHLLLNFMKYNDKLVDVCLKIFANACKKDERIRRELIEANILHLLGSKLRNECDFSNGSLVLYSALIVILVQGNRDAQNQMKISGCLSSLIRILNGILKETEHDAVPSKITELIIYAIIACIKNPRHDENQTEVRWTTVKILDYLGKRKVFENETQLQIVRCLWSLLRSVVDGNEINQRVFINYQGFTVLFRSMQEILEEEKQDGTGSLLSKMTGLLVKLKSQKEFLCQASNFCSVMILCSLFKSRNILVLQHAITFLDSLTQEIPEVLSIIKDEDVVKTMKKVRIAFSKTKTSAELCQDIWGRMGLRTGNETPSGDFPTQEEEEEEERNFGDVVSNLNFPTSPQNYVCLLHGTDGFEDVRVYSDSLINDMSLRRGRVSALRNELREKRSRKMIKSGSLLPRRNRNRLDLVKFLTGGVLGIFRKLWTLFKGGSKDVESREILCSLDDEFLIVNNQWYDYYAGIPLGKF